MEKVKQEALDRALTLLKSLGCAYEVQGPDGVVHKFGQKMVARRSWSDTGKAVGVVVRGALEGIEVGEVRSVPVDTLPINTVQNRCSTHMCNNFGAGSGITTLNRDKNCVEVLRVL